MDGMKTVELENRRLYEQDWVGMKVLGDKDAISLRTIPGGHMDVSSDQVREIASEFFGSEN